MADLIAARPRTGLLALFTAGLLLAATEPWQVGVSAASAAVMAAAIRAVAASCPKAPGGSGSTPAIWAVAAALAVSAGACVGDVRGRANADHPVRGDVSALPHAKHPNESGILEGIRMRARHALDPGLPPPAAALLVGMALGDDSALTPSVREEFRTASLTHVTAASGQNVALLLILATPLLVMVGLGLRGRLVACAILACAYVPLAGGDSPIRRACVMALAALAARGRGSPGGVVHPLLLAAAATVTLDPTAPESLGWQLSFAAVTGMAVLGPPLQRALERTGLPRAVAAAMAVTTAATAATTPLIAHSTGRVSFVAIPANLIAEPAVAAAMALALAACAVGQVSATLAEPLAWAAALPAGAVLEVAHLLGGLDWAASDWKPGRIEFLASLLMPLALAAIVRIRVRRRPRGDAPGAARRPADRSRWLRAGLAVSGVVAIVGFAMALARGPGHAGGVNRQRAVFLDVGQGDAELLADGESGILVDTGPPGTPIARMVERAGVKRIVALVLTHGQADHAGALADLVTRYRPEVVIDGTVAAPGSATAEVQSILGRESLPTASPEPGLRIDRGSLVFEVLAAGQAGADGDGAVDDPNGSSIVGLGTVGSLTVLLTADAESPTLLPLALRPVDVIKIAHHGSADPGLPEVLERTLPRVGVIETGPNPYGHPTRSTVRAASAIGRLLRTDHDGSIAISEHRDGSLAIDRGPPG